MVDVDEFEVDVSVEDEENVDIEEIKFGVRELCISEGVNVTVDVEVSERGVNAATRESQKVVTNGKRSQKEKQKI
jgi:hypothetical protein